MALWRVACIPCSNPRGVIHRRSTRTNALRIVWYQRIAMFPLAWILGVACLTNDRRVGRYALPLALISAVIALWQSLLYAGIVKEATKLA